MCGILGIVARRGEKPSVSDEEAARLRDVMAHRGPDGAGLWRGGNVVLGHRRLSVVDPTPSGAQPMFTSDGRFGIVYNGELYNDVALRRELGAMGVVFRSTSDTETLLRALELWGVGALERLRGMFAFGLVDTRSGDVLLARDPIGIKPLYWARVETPTGAEVVFASEIAAILSHGHMPVRPDFAVVSSYLTTIRTTLGERTLFEGVRCVQPGEAVWVRAEGLKLERARGAWVLPWVRDREAGEDVGSESRPTRDVISESVGLHLRSDVPLCTLLSGGLDSSIVAYEAKSRLGELWSYCAGCKGGDGAASDDFRFADEVARAVGTRHQEAAVTREMFRERWPMLVAAAGVPLSTPNEVAIHEVASRLRSDGQVVTLSGEGADEFFAGYELPMRQAAEFERQLAGTGATDAVLQRAMFQIDSNAWVPRGAKANILRGEVFQAAGRDEAMGETYRQIMAACEAEAMEDSPLQMHLMLHQRVNLVGLLLRLDSATMRASVEGRTPFADVEVARAANGLAMGLKFGEGDGKDPSRSEGVPKSGTKIVLREGYRGVLPVGVIDRPKASFPLPFQEWVADFGGVLRASGFAREIFTAQAIETVASRPGEFWSAAWPMVNLALWGEVFA